MAGAAGAGGKPRRGRARRRGGGGQRQRRGGRRGSPPHTGTWHIMPLGDSITGSTCYPQLLSKELISKGHTNFTFIGMNLNNQSCGAGAPNLMTEGHGGYDVTYLVTNSPPQSGHGTLAELQRWAAEKPDVVLMQYGTNDVWNGDSSSSILSAYSFVVDQFRSQNPRVIFFVAQILPMHPERLLGLRIERRGVEFDDSILGRRQDVDGVTDLRRRRVGRAAAGELPSKLPIHERRGSPEPGRITAGRRHLVRGTGRQEHPLSANPEDDRILGHPCEVSGPGRHRQYHPDYSGPLARTSVAGALVRLRAGCRRAGRARKAARRPSG